MLEHETKQDQGEWVSRSINIVLLGALIGLPTTFGVLGKPTEMGLSIVACAIAFCFANLDRVEFFKGAGFEAKIREAKKAAEEAYATLAMLREIAHPLLKGSLATVTYAGRWDGVPREKEHEIMANLQAALKALGLEDDRELSFMVRDFYNHHAADHIVFLPDVASRARIPSDTILERIQPLIVRSENYEPPSVSVVRGVLEGLSDEQKAVLEPYILDYEHYLKTHMFRRREAVSYHDLPMVIATGPLNEKALGG